MNKIDNEIIFDQEDIKNMLDELLEKRDEEWWDKFYNERNKPIPFFKVIPDENLVSYFNQYMIPKGKALDLGCGNGRNSIYLAKLGYDVDAVDFSNNSINWAKENIKKEEVDINLICESIFKLDIGTFKYDFIYDSGLLHHIKPHRRMDYLNKVKSALKPNGYFGLSCFNLEGGANISDYDVYRDLSMHGGLGFSENKLKKTVDPYFEVVEFRRMNEHNDDQLFGKSFMWTLLLKHRRNS